MLCSNEQMDGVLFRLFRSARYRLCRAALLAVVRAVAQAQSAACKLARSFLSCQVARQRGRVLLPMLLLVLLLREKMQ